MKEIFLAAIEGSIGVVMGIIAFFACTLFIFFMVVVIIIAVPFALVFIVVSFICECAKIMFKGLYGPP